MLATFVFLHLLDFTDEKIFLFGENLKLKIILANGERRVKMNRIHCVLLTILLAFAGSAFAVDSTAAATALRNGYFDIMNLSNKWGSPISHPTKDSVDGIYLFAEFGFCANRYIDSDGVYHYLLRLYIGKNMAGGRNDSIWVFTGSLDQDSINSELRKGNPLSLDYFTKLEFDSSREQYLVKSHRPSEAEINVTKKPIYGTFYILYQSGDSVAAFCGIKDGSCYYQIGCFYNNDGLFIFDSIPDPLTMTYGMGCPMCGEEIDDDEEFLRPIDRAVYKLNSDICPLYKVNGIPASQNSSNIVIQNKKQPKLQLKGNE